MNTNIEFLKRFAEYYHYPEEAEKEFLRIEGRMEQEEVFGQEMNRIVENYMYPEASGLSEALEEIRGLSEKNGENEYTVDFLFLLRCAQILEKRYEEAGIEKKYFYSMCDDFRCKLKECMECKGIPGTFVAFWNQGTFAMERFAYGRFQFELVQYQEEKEFVMSSGHVVRPGDTYVNFHIPSSGIPLTDEVRLASYRDAYRHYKHLFPDGKVLFGCSSWLLYEKHRDFLPEDSNILKFMSDFEIVYSVERDEFSNGWRIFGKDFGKPLEELPLKTSLQRAYVNWLKAGNKAGAAFGCFLFDGEKIVR